MEALDRAGGKEEDADVSLVRRAGSLHRRTGGFVWVQAVFALAVLLTVVALIIPFVCKPYPHRGDVRAQDVSNLRQVGISMQLYASDYEGRYPIGWMRGSNLLDPGSVGEVPDANAALRPLFGMGICPVERIFQSRMDPRFVRGDQQLGTAPDFAEALGPRENSFAYVAGLSETNDSELPLMFSAVFATPEKGGRGADSVPEAMDGAEFVRGAIGLNVAYCDGSVRYLPGTNITFPLNATNSQDALKFPRMR